MGLKSIGVIVAFTPALILLALLARVALGLLLLSQMSPLPGAAALAATTTKWK